MELPPLPVLPLTIEQKLLTPGGITPTAFERKNDVLTDPSLQTEVGYTELPNGDWLVAMTCPMPNVTPEMVDWWFWWHAQKSERYRLWFPGEHYAVSYAKKDRPYFTAPTRPPFRANTHFPVEKIGALRRSRRFGRTRISRWKRSARSCCRCGSTFCRPKTSAFRGRRWTKTALRGSSAVTWAQCTDWCATRRWRTSSKKTATALF